MAFSKEKAHERAEKFAAKGQHDKAAREYQSIVENDPKDIRAWLMLADCLVRSGDRGGAIDRYMQVAGYYAAQRQQQKALAVYRQVVNLDPRRFDVHQKIAQINLELGRVPDAVAIYEQLGQAQLQAGATADALVTFEIIANAEPAAVPKRLRLAELCSRERLVEKAVGHFRIAGEQLLQTGRHADFVRVAERLIYHQPDDADTIRKLARVYLQLGDARRALMKLNALLHTDAHDREGLELLADTFLVLEKPDKAASVAVELVRQLALLGEEGAAEATRVARKALEWDPNNSELRAVAGGGVPHHRSPAPIRAAPARQQAPAPAPAPAPVAAPPPVAAEVAVDESDEILDADDVMELDDHEEEPPVAQPATRRRTGAFTGPIEQPAVAANSMTERVLAESANGPVENSPDLDKILFEARVYVKYRLFEHAIEHVGELLSVQPHHTGALALRARALGELGRREESATVHVEVARLVADRDPRLAREHVHAALECSPQHAPALALRARLDGSAPPSRTMSSDDDGDSGQFDVIGDASGPLTLDGGADFAIDVAEGEPDPSPTQPIAVENRFGLSDARPLPGPDESGPTEDLAASISTARGFDASTEHADRTPLFGYAARPPRAGTGTPIHHSDRDLDLAASPDEDTGPFRPMTPREPTVDLDDEPELDLGPPARAGRPPLDDQPTEEREVPIPSKPPAPRRPSTPAAKPAWPDLADELAEIRFFVDQGLDEDASGSLADLLRKHPGHPEVVALQAEFERGTAAPPPDSGATPLVSLSSEEDEDADAYLSAIFGGEPAAPKPKKEKKVVEIRATGGVDPADAASAYDLGMAYRDMGLIDDAIVQFELASRDATWQARALVMLGTLRVHRGETDRAVADLGAAIDAATNEDELFEAKYELALVYERLGDGGAALEQLQGIAAGYRERDEKIAALGG